MTGLHPGEAHVEQDEILNMAVQRSSLRPTSMDEITSMINGLNISHSAKVSIIDSLCFDVDDLYDDDAHKFYGLLQKVVYENDENGRDETSVTINENDYLQRAKAVAAQFKLAAKFLKRHESKKSKKK